MLVTSRAPISAKDPVRLRVAQQDPYFLLQTLHTCMDRHLHTYVLIYHTVRIQKQALCIFHILFKTFLFYEYLCARVYFNLPRICSTAGGQERAQDPPDRVSQLTAAGNQTKALWRAASILTQCTISPAWVFTHFSRLSKVKCAVTWRTSS